MATNKTENKTPVENNQALTPKAATFRFDPNALEIARRVTLPLLKQKVGNPIYVVFTKPYEVSNHKIKDDKKEPATIAEVIDLELVRKAQIILGAVAKSTLDESYPDNGYVGKAFKIELFSVEGKKYHQAEIIEFKLPAGLDIDSIK